MNNSENSTYRLRSMDLTFGRVVRWYQFASKRKNVATLTRAEVKPLFLSGVEFERRAFASPVRCMIPQHRPTPFDGMETEPTQEVGNRCFLNLLYIHPFPSVDDELQADAELRMIQPKGIPHRAPTCWRPWCRCPPSGCFRKYSTSSNGLKRMASMSTPR